MAVADRQLVKKSHARLAETLSGFTDDTARRPSLLPAWTVGHVLTHLARNADSHVRLLEAAARGEVADQYAGGDAQRAADIEAGSGRPAAALVADATESAARLERTWDATPDDAWRTGRARMSSGVWPAADLPFPVAGGEVHHVDLALAYASHDWPDAYVEAELARTLAGLPGGDRRRLLAWLVGRAGAPILGPWNG